jgi:hypothetical protein
VLTLTKHSSFNEVEVKDVDELLECNDNDDMSTDGLKQVDEEPELLTVVVKKVIALKKQQYMK